MVSLCIAIFAFFPVSWDARSSQVSIPATCFGSGLDDTDKHTAWKAPRSHALLIVVIVAELQCELLLAPCCATTARLATNALLPMLGFGIMLFVMHVAVQSSGVTAAFGFALGLHLLVGRHAPAPGVRALCVGPLSTQPSRSNGTCSAALGGVEP
jgi:hypothetical protein